jgi:hypothetical protein
MSEAHTTTTPEQAQTDEWAVFADNPQDLHSNLALIKRVEVPRYAVPTADGAELSREQRLSMAVYWAVKAEDSAYPMMGVAGSAQDYEMVEGQEFMVMTDLEEPMEFAYFEQNPTIDSCWNPNEETAAEFTGEN